MYLRDSRVLDYLLTRPDWDGKTIVLMGGSMGGQQSLALAGLRPDKISAVLVCVPAGADSNGDLHGRAAGYPNWPSDKPDVMKTALYFDTVNFAPRIKAPVMAAMGFIDTISPPAGVWTMLNEVAGPVEALPLVEAEHEGDDDLRFAQDVAFRAALAVDNARAYGEAEKANRLKDEFLATLSHELRTPLNAVLGYSRLLQSGMMTPDRHRQALGIVARNATALIKIVGDILDVSRIISGKIRLMCKRSICRRVVSDAVDTLRAGGGRQADSPAGDPRSARRTDLRRSRSAAADRLEPAVERGEIHAEARASCRCGSNGSIRTWRSSSATTAAASRPTSFRTSSSDFARRTAPRRGSTAASVSAWQLCGISSNCTAGRFMRRAAA